MTTAAIDRRVSDMRNQLYRYLEAGATDEDGNCPEPEESSKLEDFLYDLSNNILEPNKIGCPIVQPFNSKTIRLNWTGKKYDNYTDVNLHTLEAEHRVVGNKGIVDRMVYDFGDSNYGWVDFEQKAIQWIKE